MSLDNVVPLSERPKLEALFTKYNIATEPAGRQS